MPRMQNASVACSLIQEHSITGDLCWSCCTTWEGESPDAGPGLSLGPFETREPACTPSSSLTFLSWPLSAAIGLASGQPVASSLCFASAAGLTDFNLLPSSLSKSPASGRHANEHHSLDTTVRHRCMLFNSVLNLLLCAEFCTLVMHAEAGGSTAGVVCVHRPQWQSGCSTAHEMS